ncbi:MAG TPA: winged helix-turn-helix domain-containing protein [Pseudomonas sp.]|uniref:ATP-binding protein n=1 Tax=Pseudomonas sp. TaxID=306 RepID=UPI002BD64DD7|nr:winged helix-turn-helix domain-containing protein [Pseudomonas sp.]HWH88511.1 winged helix-turn-helix domain-containing protein [Pseudomonas sp.]
MNNHNDMNPATVLLFGPYAFHVRQRLILEGEQPLRMGGRAMDILQVLVERAGEVVSKEQLIARVWPTSVVEEINLRVHIAALRRALGDGTDGQRYIVHVPQRGYSFIAAVRHDSAVSRLAETLAAPHHNLPARLTSIIGRDALIGGLVRQMPACRLMTITGAPGVGKTTVALRVAELLLQYFRDGVWWLDLAGSEDEAALLDHLLRNLGTDFSTLIGRHALLILDNCDHQRDRCAALVETLLHAAPRLSILVTGREALHVAQETVHFVPLLAIPKRSTLETVEEAMSYPAVQLFVSRVRARQHGISLREQDLPGVREICRQLDGLPLAIELAAAQIDALGLIGLQAQVEKGLQLLGQGRRTAVPRHQSMAAAIDWSFDHLTEMEQRVLLRLSVFSTGFTLEAAVSVISCANLAGSRLTAIIEGLARKSLLIQQPIRATVRYWMLNTVRRYARDQLERSDEKLELEHRHARYLSRTRNASGRALVAQAVE